MPRVDKWKENTNDKEELDATYEVSHDDGWVHAEQTDKYGSDVFSAMTPVDARRLASALVRAAIAAERHERWRTSGELKGACNKLNCDPRSPQLRCLRLEGHVGPGDAWSAEVLKCSPDKKAKQS